jgi:HEAT repeat protein
MTATVRRSIFAVLALAAFGPIVRAAGEGIDSIMLRDPVLVKSTIVQVFGDDLLPLWLQMLARPEAEYKVRAAGTIADAHRRGMKGLSTAVPKLIAELDKKDAPSAVRVALVQALSVLDAKEAAPAMHRAATDGDIDVRQIVDPCLTRWQYEPVRATWLERIQVKPSQRGTILAIRGLLAAKDERAIPRLRAIASAADELPPVRLEAAAALAELQPRGLEPDARKLGGEAGPRGIDARVVAATLLRRHDGADAIALLQAFIRDPEPTVAARAMTRLVELDPKHAAPVLDAALANPDAAVRLLAVDALRRDPTDANYRKLGDRLADPHPDVRTKARLAFLELAKTPAGSAAARREGMRILAGSFWGGLQQAAILLGQLDHEAATARLLQLLSHERHEVFVTAAWSLRALDVAETTAPALDIFKARHRIAMKDATKLSARVQQGLDEQLSQLAQFLGTQKYAPASAALRTLIPAGSGPMETRAAAIWALGKIHEGQTNLGFEGLVEGRLNATMPTDLEPIIIRRMCALTLGRVRATGTVKSLRTHYGGKPSQDDVSNACGWALERITGEKVPPPGIEEERMINFFAIPIRK